MTSKTLKFHIFFFAFFSAFSLNGMEEENQKLPFVYHPKYNISVFGLEKLHPFDTHKYAHIAKRLKDHFGWKDDQFEKPEKATDDYLKTFHSAKYFDSLNQSWKELVIRVAGLSLFSACLSRFVSFSSHKFRLIFFSIYGLWGLLPFQARAYSQAIDDTYQSMILYLLIPGPILRYFLLDRMKYAVNGTKIALEKVLEKNGPEICINLLGGYTNACKTHGGNCSFFNDIALALQAQITKNKNFKALIIDLGLCCGNANIEFAQQYPDNVTIIDIHSYQNYPFARLHLDHKAFTQNKESFAHLVSLAPYGIDKGEQENFNTAIIQKCPWGNDYIKIVQNSLSKIANQRFDCIIFNAGSSMYKWDDLSALSFGITQENIIERDRTIVKFARNKKTPLVIIAPSGLNQKSADLVADSLISILKK